MMRRILLLISLLTVVLIGGCSNSAVRDGIDTKRAADDNAELGQRYMEQGNYQWAMEKLNHALTFEPNHVATHQYLGELYRRLGRDEEADDHFSHAVDYAEDDNSLLFHNYGQFLCSRDRIDAGVKQLKKGLDNPIYPRRFQIYEELGLCLERKPDLEQAEMYLRKGLELNPRTYRSLLAMARISFAKKSYLSARAYLQRYSSVARHTPESLWLGVRVERILGDKNALASYGLALKGKFPDAAETRLYLKSQ